MTNDASSSPIKTISKNPNSKSKNKSSIILTFILCIIAIMGVLFLWQQDMNNLTKIKAVEMQIGAMRQIMDDQNKTQTNLQAAVAEIQSQQNKLSTDQNWNIAGYLVRLAHIEYTMLHNPEQSLQLLVSADANLATDQSPRAQTLKTAINNDISALNNISSANTQTKLNQIAELNQQVAALIPGTRKQFHPTMPKPLAKGRFWDNVKQSVIDFENLVVIRHNDKPIQPLLAPENFELLKAAVRVQLGLAQWALISQQTAAYVSALQNAATWLSEYAAQNDDAQLIAKQLTALAQQPITSLQTSSLQSWQTWQKLNKEN